MSQAAQFRLVPKRAGRAIKSLFKMMYEREAGGNWRVLLLAANLI
jgi:hypothetical protein